jgi:hypothetical protein
MIDQEQSKTKQSKTNDAAICTLFLSSYTANGIIMYAKRITITESIRVPRMSCGIP